MDNRFIICMNHIVMWFKKWKKEKIITKTNMEPNFETLKPTHII